MIKGSYVFIRIDCTDYNKSGFHFLRDFAYHQAVGYYGAFYTVFSIKWWCYEDHYKREIIYRFKACLKQDAV